LSEEAKYNFCMNAKPWWVVRVATAKIPGLKAEPDSEKNRTMSKHLVIYLKNGQTIEGTLSRPFKPRDSDIEVYVGKDERRYLFSLDEICVVAFALSPPWFRPDHSEGIEEIQTTSGKSFQVEVFPPGVIRLGFIGLLTDEKAVCRTLFFSSSGVRYPIQKRKLESILLADHASSETQATTVDS